jgi:hypothetical protein
MSMSMHGRTFTAEEVLRGIQKHLGCEGDLEGDITHAIRTAYRWRRSEKGIEFHWKDIDRAYNEYRYRTGELPDCAYRYFAEVVDPQKTGQSP